LSLSLLRFIILNSSLDCVLGQHRAVELHWRQLEVGRNILVLYLHSLFQFHAFQNLGRVRATSNGGSTSKSLKNSLVNRAGFLINLDLQFHNVTASRGTNKTSSYVGILFVE